MSEEENEVPERRIPSDRRKNTDRRFEARVAQSVATSREREFQKKFETDSDSRLAKFFLFCLLINLGLGVFFTIKEIIIPEILQSAEDSDMVLGVFKKEELKEEKKEKKEVKEKIAKKTGGGGKQTGKGNPKDVSGVGVLKLISSQSTSSSHAAYDLVNSKFQDIDKALSKIAGLKTTGNTRLSGRKGRQDAGFNEGFAEGGTGGIDDLLSGLTGGDDMRVGVEAKGKLVAPSATEIDMGQGGSRRSAASILRVVRQHMPGLRHTYNKYLKTNPGFGGKINLKFTIAPSGSVVSVALVSSTTGVGEFDGEVRDKVRRWVFEAITGTGNDVVTIPFTFSE